MRKEDGTGLFGNCPSFVGSGTYQVAAVFKIKIMSDNQGSSHNHSVLKNKGEMKEWERTEVSWPFATGSPTILAMKNRLLLHSLSLPPPSHTTTMWYSRRCSQNSSFWNQSWCTGGVRQSHLTQSVSCAKVGLQADFTHLTFLLSSDIKRVKAYPSKPTIVTK